MHNSLDKHVKQKRKKIGILSMQRICNYGSYLQSWSLKNMLTMMGYDVEFVDYHIEGCYAVDLSEFKKIKRTMQYYKRNYISNLKAVIKYIRYKLTGKTILDKRFDQEWLDIGISPIKKYRRKVDVLVIGSDEVFNCLQSNPEVGFSKELFGYRNRAKRVISYAASFGNTTYERLRNYGAAKKVKNLMSNIDSISVRDENSSAIVENLMGIKPYSHLDPVLVGDFSRISEKKITEEKYLLVYGYGNRFNTQEQEQIKRFAKENALTTLSIGGKQDFCDIHIDCSVYDVLAYFKNAEYVVTDTFHGSIFSIISHTPFVTIIRKTVGETYGNEEKISDMLKKMKLDWRILLDLQQMDELLKQPISFTESDEIRNRERNRTLKYLKSQIEK